MSGEDDVCTCGCLSREHTGREPGKDGRRCTVCTCQAFDWDPDAEKPTPSGGAT